MSIYSEDSHKQMLTLSDGASDPAPLLLFQSDFPEEEELRLTLNHLSAELLKLDDIHWICPLMQCSEEVRVITGRVAQSSGSVSTSPTVCFVGLCAEQQQ